jgi:hypothetical protein
MELQRLHRKIYRFRAIQIYPSVVAGSVPRNWLNASLLAQRLVAVSIFLTKKKNTKKMSQLHALESARYAAIIPINRYYIFSDFSYSLANST